jgi:hypothetical protein
MFHYLFKVKTSNKVASYLIFDFDPCQEPVTLGREAREYYHLPKVNSQTSGGKEVSYFSILDWLQAKSSHCPKNYPFDDLFKKLLFSA